MRLISILQVSPDTSVLLASAGLVLIYLELNRPGLVLPGAVGLLAILLSISALLSFQLNGPGIFLLLASVLVPLLSLCLEFSWLVFIAAGCGIVFGCLHLLKPNQVAQIHVPTAFAAGLLGPGTSVLTAIARRASTNKGLD